MLVLLLMYFHIYYLFTIRHYNIFWWPSKFYCVLNFSGLYNQCRDGNNNWAKLGQLFINRFPLITYWGCEIFTSYPLQHFFFFFDTRNIEEKAWKCQSAANWCFTLFILTINSNLDRNKRDNFKLAWHVPCIVVCSWKYDCCVILIQSKEFTLIFLLL